MPKSQKQLRPRLAARPVSVPQNYRQWQRLQAKGLTTSTKGEPSAQMKQQVLRRDGYKCLKCGVRDAPGVALQVDHAVSRRDGGPHTLWNLQTLCWKCNNEKLGHSERPMRERHSPDRPYLIAMLLLLMLVVVIAAVFYLLLLKR